MLAVSGGAALSLFGALRHWRLLRVDHATELAGIDNIGVFD